MQLIKYEIKTYVAREIYLRINQEATARNTTRAKIIRDSLTEYFLLREELANAIESPGNIGENHTGKIIHTLLARSEERMAISIGLLEKKLANMHEQQRLITAMVDQFYLDLMQYLPKIPKEFVIDAMALSKVRHRDWLEAIKNQLANQTV